MNEKVEIAEELFEKAKLLATTKLELIKLRAIDKGSDVFASIATGATLFVISVFLIAMLSMGLALLLGELMGKAYYGFFAVAGIYGLFAVILLVFKKTLLTKPITDFVINIIFKDKRDASNKR